MMLGFPLDYLHVHYVAQEVSSYGKFLHCHDNGTMKGRVLVKVLIQDGQGLSWIVHVFVLNTDFPDIFPIEGEPWFQANHN